MSDSRDNLSDNKSVDDISDVSEYHNVEPYVKTPSPPVPIRESVNDSPALSDSLSTTSSVSSRLGHLEDQRRMHSEARQAQAARNSITSISSTKSRKSAKSDESPDKMIRNSPHEDMDEEQEEVEKVLDAEMVSDEEISARDMKAAVNAAIFDLCVVVPIMFIPTILAYFFTDEPTYNIVSMKNPAYMTPVMEFMRYNIFATISYALYVVFDVLSLVVPEAIMVFTPAGKEKSLATKLIRSQMQLLINVRHNVAMSAWLITLIPLASTLLYQSMFVTPWEIMSKLAEAKVEQVASAAATSVAEENALLADAKYSKIQQNIEIGLVFVAVLSSVVAVEKYLMQMIALNFHRLAFAKRISDTNKKFGHLLKLYEAVKFGKPRVLSSTTVNLLDIDSSADLSIDKGLHLTSVHRAKSVARLIFRTLLPAGCGRDHLLPGDFEKWTNAPGETFASFDLDESGTIDAQQMEDAVIGIYHARDSIFRGLKSNGRVVRKLDRLFFIVALAIGAVLASPVFDVGVGQLFVSFGVLSTGFGFMFHSTAKSCFESILFVFIQHPFDVGDRVVIDDETFVVDDVEVFTTTMIRWDGVRVYVANSVLSSKTIQNIRRSENQMEAMVLKVKSDTPTESLWSFREELSKLVAEHKTSFTGEVDLTGLDKLPAKNEPLSMTVMAEVKGNFQNPAKRNARKALFLNIVEQALQNCNLTKA